MHSDERLFDRVVLSCDDSYFKEFIPIVAKAWNKLWGVPVTVVQLTQNHPFIYGEDTATGYFLSMPAVPTVPIANQAKVLRHFITTCYFSERVLINDMDFLPISKWYLQERLPVSNWESTIFIISSDAHYVGDEQGKFPIGDLCATGETFRRIINPNMLGWREWVRNLAKIISDGPKANIMNSNFSDESLWRYWLRGYPTSLIKKTPGLLYPFSDRIIDRAWWPKVPVSKNIVQSGYYYGAHLPRPYTAYKYEIDQLVSWANLK